MMNSANTFDGKIRSLLAGRWMALAIALGIISACIWYLGRTRATTLVWYISPPLNGSNKGIRFLYPAGWDPESTVTNMSYGPGRYVQRMVERPNRIHAWLARLIPTRHPYADIMVNVTWSKSPRLRIQGQLDGLEHVARRTWGRRDRYQAYRGVVAEDWQMIVVVGSEERAFFDRIHSQVCNSLQIVGR